MGKNTSREDIDRRSILCIDKKSLSILLIIMMFFLSAFLSPVGVLGDGLRVLSILHGESRGTNLVYL